MSYVGVRKHPAPFTIHVCHPLSAMTQLIKAAGHAGATSSAWPTNNLALYYPFILRTPATAYKAYCRNGSSIAGNVDIGVYDDAGTRLVSTGATSQTGTTVFQLIDMTDTPLAAGRYYLAMSESTTSATFQRLISSSGHMNLIGVRQQATAHPLPSTATMAALSSTTAVFHFGIQLRTTDI